MHASMMPRNLAKFLHHRYSVPLHCPVTINLTINLLHSRDRYNTCNGDSYRASLLHCTFISHRKSGLSKISWNHR